MWWKSVHNAALSSEKGVHGDLEQDKVPLTLV